MSIQAVTRRTIPGLSIGENTVDFSGDVSAGATAVLLEVISNSGSARYEAGVWPVGATANPAGDMEVNSKTHCAVRIDGNNEAVLSLENANIVYTVIGEFTGDWYFFAEPVNLLPQVTDSVDSLIDVSQTIHGDPSAPTAQGAWIVAQGPNAGSGDNYEFNNGNNATQTPRRNIRAFFHHAVGTPGEEWTVYMENAVGLWLYGVCGGGVTWLADKYTNNDLPTLFDGTYEDLIDVGTDEGVLWDHRTDTLNATYDTRPKGDVSTDLRQCGPRLKAFSVDWKGTDNVVQGARTSSTGNLAFFRVGIIEQASAGTPPTFTGNIANQTNTAGDSVNLDISTEFDEGTAVPTTGYTVTAGTLPSGLTLSSATGVISGTIADDDQLGIEITFTTAAGAATSNAFSWTVSAAPVPPTFTGNIANQSDVQNSAITPLDITGEFNQGTGTGPVYDLAPASAALPAGINLSTAGVFTGTPTTVETATGVIVRLTNSEGTVNSNPFNWEITAAPVAPEFTGSISNQSNVENVDIGTVDFSTEFDEGNGTGVTYDVAAGTLPAGLNLNASTGEVTGTPTTVQTQTGLVIRCTTSNGSDTSNVFQWEITAAPTTQIFTVAATKPAGSLSVLDNATGIVIGTTEVEVPLTTDQGDTITWYTPFDGTYVVENATGTKTFQVRDRANDAAPWEPFATITVEQGVAPTFTGNIANQSDPENSAITPLDTSLQFNEGNGTGVAYSLAGNDLPLGLQLDENTGVIDGTPTVVDTTTGLIVRLTTSEGTADSNPFQWEVTSTGTPPSFTGNIAGQNNDEDVLITPVDVSGEFDVGTGTPVGYTDNNLPPGLSVDPVFGVISGTPTTPGTYNNCTISYESSLGSATSNPFQWVINDTTAPVLSNPQAVGVGTTTVTPRVTTNEGNGNAWAYITPDGTNPLAAEIEANGVLRVVTSSGFITWPNQGGLTPDFAYQISYLHKDAAGNSSNVERVSFRTLEPGTGEFNAGQAVVKDGVIYFVPGDTTR